MSPFSHDHSGDTQVVVYDNASEIPRSNAAQDSMTDLQSGEVDDAARSLHRDHFKTDHLLENIGQRALSGGFVTFGAQGAKFLLNIAAAAVLARLLNPRDFGLVGMVLGVTSVVGVFKELGLSTATVQRDTITQEQVSNLFWINVGFSAFLACVSALLAPLVAQFYKDPRVTNIMLALSITFLLTGSTVQHQALLTRQMRFPTLALIDVTSIAFGFTCACAAAWLGYGYWALVIQQLATVVCSLFMTWLNSGWRPRLPSRNSDVLPLLRFGARLSLADFVGLFSANTDTILLGRFYGPASVGLYTRAQVLLARPIQQVVTPINAVLIPVLSRLKSDPERYHRSYMQAYGGLAVIVFSFSAMCLALAKPIVIVILGPKWAEVIPLFAAFSFVAISGPLGAICSWIYESQGRGSDQLKNHTATGIVAIASYVVGLHWGPMGVVVSSAIASLAIRLPIIYHIAGRSGPIRTRDLWMGFLTHLPCWFVVLLTTSLAYKLVEHASPIIQLLVAAPIGAVTGAALILLFPGPRKSAFFVVRRVKGALETRFAKS